jgi:hypothetical protein
VKEIRYQVNGDSEVTLAGNSGSFSLISDGMYTVSYFAVDNNANREAAYSVTVGIDKTPPVITITGITDGATYTLGAVPAAAGYAVTDNVSGMANHYATLTGGSANGVGTYKYTVNATDRAGNSASVSATYSVVYSYSGSLESISLHGPYRLGSTIPVKFRLTDASGTHIPTATASITAQRFLADQPAADPIEVTSTSGADMFRYDAVDNQYIYNLSTKSLSGGTWQIQVTLDDGTVKTAFISLKEN